MLLGDDPLAPEYLEAAGTELAGRLLAVLEEARPTGNSAFVTTLLGRTLVERDEWALAARQLERAVSQDVGFSDAHAYLGYALDQVGCFDQARPHLLRAIALNPDSAVAHTFLGLHYDRWDHFGAARAEYERAYDLAPTNPAISVEIGQTWAAEGRYVAGEIWLREAVSLRPYDPELWEILVRFYLDHNITAGGRAVEAAEKLLVLAPHLARAHDLRGWAALQVGDYEVADEHMRRAIKLDPELASAHYHLGVLLTAQGRGGEAEESLTRAVDLDTRGEFVQLVERARSRETSAKR
jgi:Flp pilus assembly protein TadD